MLRWAVHRALRPCRLSSSRMPEALRNSSGGGREDAEPRPLPLSYKLLDGEASLPGIVLLHGLFGSKANFNSIAKALAQRTGRRVLTVDARNHGDSPHSPDMSYEAMAQDLQALLPQLDLAPCVLIGHSMGGKTAMVLSLQRPELVERLIVVDISPMPQSSLPRFSSYVAAMKAMDIPDELPRSSAWKLADEQLSLVVQNLTVRQFLLTNLVEINGHFRWRVNLDALAQNMAKLMCFPRLQESYSGPTLFLIGGDSALVQPSHHPEMRRLFPQAQIQTVPNAGHLVHADRPQDFMDTVQGFLT
ncbi:protein ABHD11 isoform X2 [Heterocephalus glaber]|uniref:sn-1-specific diacylglycerol lipase ABHD11 n=1 Tax=Heterocephalus glaber TaxID=10181 RepID=A0AAX6NYY9_HETGA|nr:protein ABHD11 isoform X2 [Heterocephalus glaber]